jgi:hydrogenase maturation protease
VECLQVGGQTLHAWQEAVEREVVLPSFRLSDRPSGDPSSVFVFSGKREFEPVRGDDGRSAALIVRTNRPISGKVDVSVATVGDGLFKITVRISNTTAAANPSSPSRDEAVMQSLLSAHTILSLEGGEFVSLLDPPAELQEIVSECNNVGTWPVIAGEQGRQDCMLSSPIILYDYPQIAPESAGNLFDGTEIDEILALRILTLTESEKQEMRHADERSREILERTEAMPVEHFMKLHGVLRGLRPADEEKQ